ncbi:MAG: glycoside hydrolase N-terminal domain-containing protein [Mangrovibacterium sp.]
MMKKIATITFCLAVWLFSGCIRPESGNTNPELWYKQPASTWVEALPVGNGRLGGMVFGDYKNERIQLNEESVWAGSKINNNNPESLAHLPEIREAIFRGDYRKAEELSNRYMLGTPPRVRSYQPLGDLFINFDHSGIPTAYRRSLDLNTGVARTEYTINGNRVIQEVFASAPQDVLVVSLTAEQPVSPEITLCREYDPVYEKTRKRSGKRGTDLPYENLYRNEDGLVGFAGQIIDKDSPLEGPGGKHMRYAAAMKVLGNDNSVEPFSTDTTAGFRIKAGKKIVVILTGATDYDAEKMDLDPSVDPYQKCLDILAEATQNNYSQLKELHEQEYRSVFARVDFSLGEDTMTQFPTDERLERLKEGGQDNGLIPLYFQYGRYLLMSSSRKPGVLPANLQGIWNDLYAAPWNADFHTNINLQMNYWPAEVCNLPETSEILTSFMERLAVPGSVTAKEMYGAKGWLVHHLTDPFGRTGVADGVWGITPLNGPWMTFPVYEHFLFTSDTTFLREKAYPLMKGAAEFVLDFLVESPEGYLVTNPSHSPENSFRDQETGEVSSLTYAATIDTEIIRELFDYCIRASEILNTDQEFAARMAETEKRLPPVVVNSKGVIREWIKDYDEPEPGHRHMSHLLGLYPLAQFTPESPELFKAAQATIERRLSYGGGHTGWSRAWIVNMYARLQNGDKAYENLTELFRKSTLPNLFDNHPPFQIDGNFGGTAGIAEMLLQSHRGALDILPALPAALPDGKISGLCGRGGFEVSMTWSKGALSMLEVISHAGGPLIIRYGDKSFNGETQKGEVLRLDGNLD